MFLILGQITKTPEKKNKTESRIQTGEKCRAYGVNEIIKQH